MSVRVSVSKSGASTDPRLWEAKKHWPIRYWIRYATTSTNPRTMRGVDQYAVLVSWVSTGTTNWHHQKLLILGQHWPKIKQGFAFKLVSIGAFLVSSTNPTTKTNQMCANCTLSYSSKFWRQFENVFLNSYSHSCRKKRFAFVWVGKFYLRGMTRKNWACWRRFKNARFCGITRVRILCAAIRRLMHGLLRTRRCQNKVKMLTKKPYKT